MIKTELLLFFTLSIVNAIPSILHFQINPDESLFGKNHSLSYINIYVCVYANLVFFYSASGGITIQTK